MVWHADWVRSDTGRSWRLLSGSDGATLRYDGNGNVVTRAVGGAEWRYVYDAENRLKEVWRGAERVASFRYDPEGNRVVREVAGLRTVAMDEGYEVRGGGVRKVYRLSGETVAVREGSTVYAAVGDHLGSVTVLAQGGSPAGVTRYLPYGAIRWESGLWSTDRRFTGQRWEASLGLYDYRARFYDPALGRFLQPDPLVPEPGNPQALNRYAYVNNNPLKYTDPSGHWMETVWDIANIAWDIHEIRQDPGNLWNWGALVVDVGTALLPGVPAFAGVVSKGGKAAVEVASHADEVVDAAKAVSKAEDVRHARRSAEITQSVLDKILPTKFDPKARFGPALYVAQQGETAVAEVAAHGGKASHVIRFQLDLSKAKVLDLTDPAIAKAWGYVEDVDAYTAHQQLAQKAMEQGYNVIKFPRAGLQLCLVGQPTQPIQL